MSGADFNYPDITPSERLSICIASWVFGGSYGRDVVEWRYKMYKERSVKIWQMLHEFGVDDNVIAHAMKAKGIE